MEEGDQHDEIQGVSNKWPRCLTLMQYQPFDSVQAGATGKLEANGLRPIHWNMDEQRAMRSVGEAVLDTILVELCLHTIHESCQQCAGQVYRQPPT